MTRLFRQVRRVAAPGRAKSVLRLHAVGDYADTEDALWGNNEYFVRIMG